MKVIFFDIDGTLDDDLGRVPESAAEAVRLARRNGAKCVVNSGRPFSHIIPAVKEIGFDGYICACGQHIIIDGETVRRRAISAEDSRRTYLLAEECGLDGYFEAEEGVVIRFFRPLTEIIKIQIVNFEKQGLPVYYSLPSGFCLDKCCVWRGEGSDEARFMRGTAGLFTPIDRGDRMHEMVVNGCSKAEGMREFLDLKGCADAETYAIGDSPNDLTMLKAVDHPIAMGGSKKELTDIAEFVTDRLENDGVKRALEHYSLI